jgi:hypothetical protein
MAIGAVSNSFVMGIGGIGVHSSWWIHCGILINICISGRCLSSGECLIRWKITWIVTQLAEAEPSRYQVLAVGLHR